MQNPLSVTFVQGSDLKSKFRRCLSGVEINLGVMVHLVEIKFVMLFFIFFVIFVIFCLKMK